MIPVAQPIIGTKELEYVSDAVKSGWVSSQGKYVQGFEKKFAKYCGVNYGVSTASGTVALHLALASLGVGKGDEVIVPALSFIAVANAVTYTGAKPIFVDSEPYTWCIDPSKIEEKVTQNTKAIIPVHLYGHPCEMEPILELASRYSLCVIEDAAEAHGAEYKGRKVGSLGDAACFSFYGNKIITTGEGGMVVTNNPKLAERAKLLKNHGMSRRKKYWHPVIGFNYRMTNMQAAIGLAQLEKIDMILEKKRAITAHYSSLLDRVDSLILPPEATWAKSAYWVYSVLIKEDATITRDELAKRLKNKGVETRPFFIPIHKMPPYRNKEIFPVAEDLSHRGVNLPSFANLMEHEIETICTYIEEALVPSRPSKRNN